MLFFWTLYSKNPGKNISNKYIKYIKIENKCIVIFHNISLFLIKEMQPFRNPTDLTLLNSSRNLGAWLKPDPKPPFQASHRSHKFLKQTKLWRQIDSGLQKAP